MSENDTHETKPRRGGIMRITPEFLHDLLLLPESVTIEYVNTTLTRGYLEVEVSLEGAPMPEVGEGERIPEVQAVYSKKAFAVGAHQNEEITVLEKFQRWDAKRDEWVRLA